MITHDQFKYVYKRNWVFSKKLRTIIDSALISVDYSNNKRYKIDKKSGKSGEDILYVSFLYFKDWIWSWLNSINTNYTSIYYIVEYVCRRENINLKELSFYSHNIESTTNLLGELIEKYKQEIFRPGSEVFRKMFFITQMTWNKGIISTVVFLHLMSKKYEINYNLNYKRGDNNDMTKGVDYDMFFRGSTKNVQHKSCDLDDDDGDYFTSKTFKYSESNYRNSVELITIQSGNEIHLFENSTDQNLIGERNQKFFVNKKLRLEHMFIEGESKEIESILVEMNKICFDKNIIFMFERNESTINQFIVDELDGIKTIRFFLNNLEDENLLSMLRDKLTDLQNLP